MVKNIMKTIAIISLSPIGDVINTSPVCIELKKHYPNAKLVFITVPRSRKIAECIPGVDIVYEYDKKGKYKGFRILNIALDIRKQEKIDAAIILNETFRSALFAFLIGAKKRIGREYEGRSFLLTHRLPHLKEEIDWQIHVSEHYMRVLKSLGLYNPDYEIKINYSKKDNDFITDLLNQNFVKRNKLLGLCPCTAVHDKDLNPLETAKFINFINDKTDYKVVIIGIETASVFVQKLQELGVNDFIDLTCKTNISQLIALIARFNILVSADSSPMHMGFALKIPTLGIFMNDIMKKWGPKNYDINNIIYKPGIVNGELMIQEFINLSKKSAIYSSAVFFL